MAAGLGAVASGDRWYEHYHAVQRVRETEVRLGLALGLTVFSGIAFVMAGVGAGKGGVVVVGGDVCGCGGGVVIDGGGLCFC